MMVSFNPPTQNQDMSPQSYVWSLGPAQAPSHTPRACLLPGLVYQGGLWVARTPEVMKKEGNAYDIPALPGLPVTLFGGNGFLRGGTGLGGKGGRRVPGIVAKRLYNR